MLLTGSFGVGKTTVAVEMADILEKRGELDAVIDLDWLTWAAAADDDAEHRMMLTNLAPVLENYRRAGIRSFIFARAIRNASDLKGLRDTVAMPLHVVRLTLEWEEIELRLSSDVTSGRKDDLREAAARMSRSEGEGFEDVVIANDRPVRVVALEILAWLGWR